jgi:Thiamine pyrophosphate-requiring enzymes [acetolactate synthase, pyruvate dehydrogenase (cytochrome), glyoxylate carboligase, phosphonopyruvate decarboxylase]
VAESDLLIAVGVRFDDRVTGKLATFAPRAKVIHIDIDPANVGKNRAPDLSLIADARAALLALSHEILKLDRVDGGPKHRPAKALVDSTPQVAARTAVAIFRRRR